MAKIATMGELPELKLGLTLKVVTQIDYELKKLYKQVLNFCDRPKFDRQRIFRIHIAKSCRYSSKERTMADNYWQ